MRKDHEIDLAYVGFAKLTAKLAAKGAKNPAALAAAIGRKKYGAKKFNKAAASGVPLKPKKKGKKKLVANVSLATPRLKETAKDLKARNISKSAARARREMRTNDRNAQAAKNLEQMRSTPAGRALPADKKVTAHEVTRGNSNVGELRTVDGKIVGPEFKSQRSAQIAATKHNKTVSASSGFGNTPSEDVASARRMAAAGTSINGKRAVPNEALQKESPAQLRKIADSSFYSLDTRNRARAFAEGKAPSAQKEAAVEKPKSASLRPVNPDKGRTSGAYVPKARAKRGTQSIGGVKFNDQEAKDGKSSAQVENAKKMFGNDMSKRSTANVKAAAKLGDASAIAELARRSGGNAATASAGKSSKVDKAYDQLTEVQKELASLRAIPAARRGRTTNNRILALQRKQTRLNTITRFGVGG